MLAACCAVGLMATASTSLAAGPPTVTTSPATQVGRTSAILNGVVSADGSGTAWQFQYGQSAATLKLAPTNAGTIGATDTDVPVSVLVTGLAPGTTYSFKLLAFNAFNTAYYSLFGHFTSGATLTFTTMPAPGAATVRGHEFRVRDGIVTIPLTCASMAACEGRLSLTGMGKLSRHGHSKRFSCLEGKRFTTAAGKTSKVHGHVSSVCLAALRSAHRHRIKSTLLVTFTTGQRKIAETVTLFT
jgi:hypothetical protein